MKILILAGGFATRLWPLTEKRAKALLPVGGKPLLSRILDKLSGDFGVIVSTNMVFEEDFEDWKNEYSDRRIDIFLEDSASDEQKTGAVGAISMAIRELGINEDLLILAGDNFFGFDFEDFLGAYDGRNPLLAAKRVESLEEAKQFGVLTVDGDYVDSFEEKPENPQSTLVSTACYLLPKEVFAHVHECARLRADNMGGIIEHFLKERQRVKVFRFEEEWIDIGSFESYLRTHRNLQRTSEVDPSAKVSRSQIGDGVSVGKDCVVEDSVLENVIVMPGSVIRNCVLRNTIVDEGSELESVDLDHKMVRMGSKLTSLKENF
jgi:glucose-1-phosphate thymidylyltransferase